MKKYNDKMVGNDDVRDFHFAGAGVHAPITVSARTPEEAEKKRQEMIGKPVTKGESEGGEASSSHIV